MITNNTIRKMMLLLSTKEEARLSEIEQQITKQYKLALNDIDAELSVIYANYGQEIAEKKFVVGRLKNIQNQIRESIIKLYLKDAELIKSNLKDTYMENINLVGDIFGIDILSGKFNEADLLNAIKSDYNKIVFNKSETQAEIGDRIAKVRTAVSQGIVKGKSYFDTSRQLNKAYEFGLNRSLTIVRTETHRIQNQSKVDANAKVKQVMSAGGFGLKKKWIHGKGIAHPREDHVAMNGEYADDKGIFTLPDGTKTEAPGLTGKAKHDINCGCTFIYELTK